MNLIPNIDVAVDINSLAPVFIDHILNVNDTNSRTFSVTLYANNQKINLYSGNFTAKAAISVNNILLDDDVTALIQTDSTVAVTVDNKYLTLIPGVMKIQLTITGGNDVIVTPLPILARVTSDLAQTAQILPDSHSSYSEIVAEIVAARGDYDNLAQALSHLMGFLNSETVNNATDTGKVYYTTTDKALIIPVSAEFSQAQFRLARDGKIYSRRRSRSSTSVDFPAWGSFADISAGVDPEIIRQIVEAYIAEHGIDLTGVERTENRVNAINAQSDDEHYPTAGAVRRVYQLLDEADTNIRSSIGSLESGKANKSETYTKTQVDTALSGKANTSDIPDISGKADKATTLAGYGITDAYKKIEINQMFNQVDIDLQGKADALDTYTKTQTDTLLNAKESTANKVTAVNSSASDTQYPSAKAVYTLVTTVANNCEVKANKVTAIGSGSTDTQYPSAKAVYNAIQTAIGGVENGSY